MRPACFPECTLTKMKLLNILSKSLAAATAMWAAGIAVYFLFFAQVTIRGVNLSATTGQPPVSQAYTQYQNWALYNGVSGVTAVLAFALLLIAGAYTAWRGSLGALVLLTVLALVASFITGFSIGGAFLPGAFGLLASLILRFIRKEG